MVRIPTEAEQLASAVAKSTAISFGIQAPYRIDNFRIEVIGFANIPVVLVDVYYKGDTPDMVPIVRQFVFRELESHGVNSGVLVFRPTVGREKDRTLFVDDNESSQSYGKRKYGARYRFHFEIVKEFKDHFEWGGFCNKYGKFKTESAE